MNATNRPAPEADPATVPAGLRDRTPTPESGRLASYLRFFFFDHAFLRLGFSNAHWVDPKLLRTNQPWPFQLARWKKQGIRTVINLRGEVGSFYPLEKRACEKLGLKLESFRLTSHSLPRREEIIAIKDLFDRIEYPALLHCKSGADRAGMMSALYCHLHLGQPIAEARKQLGLKYLHFRSGSTGVLDHLFEVYLRDVAPRGVSFLDWVKSPEYDFKAITTDFKPTRWGSVLVRNLLRRE